MENSAEMRICGSEIGSRDEWLKWRRMGIGASDTPALLGLSRYGTPLSVYLSKVDQEPDRPPTMRQRIGLAMESGIARLYEQETGRRIVREQVRAEHPDAPWLRATIDGVTECGRVVEFKTVAGDDDEFGDEGTDEISPAFLAQLTHQMLIMDVHEADCAVLFRGRDFRVFTVKLSESLGELVWNSAMEMWGRVIRRDPPEPTLPEDRAVVGRMFRKSLGDPVQLDADWLVKVEAYRRLGEAEKEIKRQKETIAAETLMAIGNAPAGILPNGEKITKVVSECAAYEVAAHTKVYPLFPKAKKAKA